MTVLSDSFKVSFKFKKESCQNSLYEIIHNQLVVSANYRVNNRKFADILLNQNPY